MRRIIRGREVDAILFSSMVTATLSVPLRQLIRRSGVVSAAIVNGLDATTSVWPYPLLVRQAFASLDLVMPISRATGAACVSRGLHPSKSKVISLGIRLDRFTYKPDRDAARSNIVPTGANPRLVLCSVGRLVPRKGVAWFVANVMPLLPNDVLCLVAGDGPDMKRITSLIEQYRLGDSVKLLGAISDLELADLYHGSDLFIMPNIPVANDMEGFGLVMVEAGLCGLPVVASEIEGISDVITEGVNGHLVASGDADQFRDAIMRYYSNPSALLTISESAKAHTVSRFGWTGVTERYVKAIEELRHRQSSQVISS
jgi:phosphatidylinositol alpha-1,6-mannosyltransferase